MRLIDADAIKLEKGFFENIDNVPKFFEWLGKQPTIDAVPVVRCKDCIYYRKSDKGHPDADWCRRLICGTIKPDYFCADGEREEE